MEESGELIEMVLRAYPLSTGTIQGMSEERKLAGGTSTLGGVSIP